MNRLDRYFEITRRGSTVPAELRGGIVSVIAMAYIIVLNPIILAGPKDVAGNQLQFTQVSAVTAFTAGVMTILFGVIARLPRPDSAGYRPCRPAPRCSASSPVPGRTSSVRPPSCRRRCSAPVR